MLKALGPFEPAAMQRLTLLLNHVLGSEAVATARLAPHAGRRMHVALAGWPRWLPRPPALDFRVTPAGLLEWCGDEPSEQLSPGRSEDSCSPPRGAGAVPGDRGQTFSEEAAAGLRVVVDATNPALAMLHSLAGDRPHVAIEGDPVFATDVHWLIEHLRWDIEDDLAKVVGAVPARELARLGGWVAGGLREAARLAARVVPGARQEPPADRDAASPR